MPGNVVLHSLPQNTEQVNTGLTAAGGWRGRNKKIIYNKGAQEEEAAKRGRSKTKNAKVRFMQIGSKH